MNPWWIMVMCVGDLEVKGEMKVYLGDVMYGWLL